MSKWVKSVFSDRSDHARSYSVSDCDSDRVGGHNVPIPTKVQRSEISLRIVYVVSMINQGSSQ